MNKRIQSGNTDLPDTKMGFHSSKEDEQLVISPAKVILDPEGDSQFLKRKTDSNDNNNSHEDEEWRRCLYFCYPCKESGHTFELFSWPVSSATHFSTVCSLGRDDYRMLHLGYSVWLGMKMMYCKLWSAWELSLLWVTWLVVIKDSSCCSCQFWGSQIWDSALTTYWEQMASWRGLWAGDLQCQWWTWLIAGSSREAIGHS